MAKVTVLRGYSASGKSTYARKSGAFVVSRDAIRAQITGNSRKTVLDPAGEALVSRMEEVQIVTALAAGTNVVVDNTNLVARYAKRYLDIAVKEGAEWAVVDFPTDVETCVERNAFRNDGVPERVIREQAKRHPIKSWPVLTPNAEPLPKWDVYTPDPFLPRAWVFDIDGTLATLADGYSPYDPEHYPHDLPNKPVVRALRQHRQHDYIVLLSGRGEEHVDATVAWLDKHGINFDALYMRPEGDTRNDAIVKSELFDKHVAPQYNIRAVYDDRDRVVDMWRARGIPCFQVNYGAF